LLVAKTTEVDFPARKNVVNTTWHFFTFRCRWPPLKAPEIPAILNPTLGKTASYARILLHEVCFRRPKCGPTV